MLDPKNIKGWKAVKQSKNIETFEQYHNKNFVKRHKGKDAGTDFLGGWETSVYRIYDLFKNSKDWRQRKHKRKVAKPEHTTEDNCKNCGCGCWYAVNLPPFEKRNMFVHYENLYSLILLFEKHRNL